MIECRKCTAGACSHGAQCPMMIRWYDDPYDGTFWRRCECDAWIEPPQGYAPVTVRRIADRPGDTEAHLRRHSGLYRYKGPSPARRD